MNRKLRNGYTLIELLAVMIILIVVGAIVASILISALRGGNKSLTTNDIRQNGSNAIAQMSKMIAYSKSFNGVYDETTHQWTSCVGSAPGQRYYSLKITSFDEGVTTFNCAAMVLSSKSGSLSVPLVNPNLDATCYFTCNQSSVATSPTIDFYLTLKKRSLGFTFLPEAQTIIDFKTSITPRNSILDVTNP